MRVTSQITEMKSSNRVSVRGGLIALRLGTRLKMEHHEAPCSSRSLDVLDETANEIDSESERETFYSGQVQRSESFTELRRTPRSLTPPGRPGSLVYSQSRKMRFHSFVLCAVK